MPVVPRTLTLTVRGTGLGRLGLVVLRDAESICIWSGITCCTGFYLLQCRYDTTYRTNYTDLRVYTVCFDTLLVKHRLAGRFASERSGWKSAPAPMLPASGRTSTRRTARRSACCRNVNAWALGTRNGVHGSFSSGLAPSCHKCVLEQRCLECYICAVLALEPRRHAIDKLKSAVHSPPWR